MTIIHSFYTGRNHNDPLQPSFGSKIRFEAPLSLCALSHSPRTATPRVWVSSQRDAEGVKGHRIEGCRGMCFPAEEWHVLFLESCQVTVWRLSQEIS